MSAEQLLAELARVSAALAPAVVPAGTERLLEALTETARRLFGASACSLALLTEDETELVYTTAAGAGAATVTGMRLPSGRGVAGWVVQTGSPVAVDDLTGDPRFAPDVAESTGYVPRAILAAPVVSDRGTLGVLTLLDRDADRPHADDDMVLLQLFCDQAAIALEGRRALAEVGRVLLEAVAAAAGSDSDLAAAAARVAAQPAPDDGDLAEVAALLVDLERRGSAERALAVRVLREVLAYTAGRPGP